MKHNEKSTPGFIVPRETVEHYEQLAIWSKMALELLDTYGPTDQVLDIINDCRENGFPRALFGLNQQGTGNGHKTPGN